MNLGEKSMVWAFFTSAVMQCGQRTLSDHIIHIFGSGLSPRALLRFFPPITVIWQTSSDWFGTIFSFLKYNIYLIFYVFRRATQNTYFLERTEYIFKYIQGPVTPTHHILYNKVPFNIWLTFKYLARST